MRLILACMILIIGVYSYSGATWAQDSDGASLATLRELASRVRTFTLHNGLRVIFYQRDTAPVFSTVIGVRVGGVDETVGTTGISHMLEHMAFKGTPDVGTTDYSREKELLHELESLITRVGPTSSFDQETGDRWQAIQKELAGLWVTDGFVREYEKRGATDLNANTGKELTKYMVSLPRSAFEFWCQVESDRILRPVMRQFYQERDVVLEERRMRYEDSPEGRLYELMLSHVFQAHPYRNPVIGYDFDIRALTASATEAFHKRYYVPANMVIGLVGDVDPERDLPLLERYFGAIPATEVPKRTTAVEPAQQGERRVTLEARASPQLMLSYRKPNYPHPDDAPISIMLEVLAGSQVSPLYVELVKRRQLATGIDFGEGPGSAYPNVFTFSLTPRTPHTNEELLAAFDGVVQRFKKEKRYKQLLTIAKRSVEVEYLDQFRSSLSLADNMVTTELIYGDWRAVFDWYDKAMRVSSEDIRRVAVQYLEPRTRTVTVLESSK